MSTITRLNLDALTDCLRQAHAEGRGYLYEYAVYKFLGAVGAETPPKCALLEQGLVPSDEAIPAIPGDKAVLKIVSPTILHKTDAGDAGVDAVVLGILPMAPALSVNLDNLDDLTAEGSLVNRVIELFRETETPLVCPVKSGTRYEPPIKALSDGGIPVFRSADTAVTALSQYIEGRLNAARIAASSGL